jgi:hypothetical protein
LIHSRCFFSYYVVFFWLLRVLPEKFGKKYTNEILAIKEEKYHLRSNKLNGTLDLFYWLEMLLFKIGIKPLFGTSRLIVFST